MSEKKLRRLIIERRLASFKVDECALILYDELQAFIMAAAGRTEAPKGEK